MPSVGAVGLGPALGPAQGGGLGRLGQVRDDPGPLQLLDHIAPAGAPLQGEGHLLLAGEAFQPGAQVQAVGRGDATRGHRPRVLIEVVEGQLLTMQIQPAYDGHRNLLELLNPPGVETSKAPRPNRRTATATAMPGRSHMPSW
jgi:hypothetical protein